MSDQDAYNAYHSELRDHVLGGGTFREFPDIAKENHGKEFIESVRRHACTVHDIEHRG